MGGNEFVGDAGKGMRFIAPQTALAYGDLLRTALDPQAATLRAPGLRNWLAPPVRGGEASLGCC